MGTQVMVGAAAALFALTAWALLRRGRRSRAPAADAGEGRALSERLGLEHRGFAGTALPERRRSGRETTVFLTELQEHLPLLRCKEGAQLLWDMACGELDGVWITAATLRVEIEPLAKDGRVEEKTLVTFFDESLDLPRFELSPEGALEKVATALGGQDIDFESHPRFSGMYLLRGDKEARVRELFTAEVMERLEAMPGLYAAGRGPRVALSPGKKLSGDKLAALVTGARELFLAFGRSAP